MTLTFAQAQEQADQVHCCEQCTQIGTLELILAQTSEALDETLTYVPDHFKEKWPHMEEAAKVAREWRQKREGSA